MNDHKAARAFALGKDYSPNPAVKNLCACYIEQAAQLETERKAREEAEQPELDHMVTRFLKWPLPLDLQADLCATDFGVPNRYGTNLLTADQAKEMLRYVLKGRATAYGFKQLECDGLKRRAEATEAKLVVVEADTIEKCARVIHKVLEGIYEEYGSYDASTNATEIRNPVAESRAIELEELEEAIRALNQSAAAQDISGKVEVSMPPVELSPAAATTDKSRGLYHKFLVERTDGSSDPGSKHYGCEYFVLDLDHDRHAIAALFAYADSCSKEYPALAKDLRAKAVGLNEPSADTFCSQCGCDILTSTACGPTHAARFAEYQSAAPIEAKPNSLGVVRQSQDECTSLPSDAAAPDWRTMSVSELAAGNSAVKAYSDNLGDERQRLWWVLIGMERAAEICDYVSVGQANAGVFKDAIRAEIERMKSTG